MCFTFTLAAKGASQVHCVHNFVNFVHNQEMLLLHEPKWIFHLHAFSPVCNGFLRFTSGATIADLLVATGVVQSALKSMCFLYLWVASLAFSEKYFFWENMCSKVVQVSTYTVVCGNSNGQYEILCVGQI